MASYQPDTKDQQQLNNHFYSKDYTKKHSGLTLKQAKQIGDEIGVDWQIVDLGQLIQGIAEEMEHGSEYGASTQVHDDDYVTSGRIAYAHLIEQPNYYTELEIMEQAGEQQFNDDLESKKQWVADQRAQHQAAWDQVA